MLPPYVRAVPTLMIAGEPEPRVDAAVMNWLSERRLHDRSSVATMGPAGARAAPGAAVRGGGAAAAEPAGPMAWGGSDMMGGGGDEGFAYLDDNTAPSDKGTVRLAGNMASFHDIGAMVAPDSRTVPGGIMAATAVATAVGAGAGASEKSRALSSAYEAALAARSRDVPGPVQRIGGGGGGGMR